MCVCGNLCCQLACLFPPRKVNIALSHSPDPSVCYSAHLFTCWAQSRPRAAGLPSVTQHSPWHLLPGWHTTIYYLSSLMVERERDGAWEGERQNEREGGGGGESERRDGEDEARESCPPETFNRCVGDQLLFNLP